jgi:hypothetical protein
MFPLPLLRPAGADMKDLIRSPLQFVRPMTHDEWRDLVSRAGRRERQQLKRNQPRPKSKPLELTNRRRGELTRPASSASL